MIVCVVYLGDVVKELQFRTPKTKESCGWVGTRLSFSTFPDPLQNLHNKKIRQDSKILTETKNQNRPDSPFLGICSSAELHPRRHNTHKLVTAESEVCWEAIGRAGWRIMRHTLQQKHQQTEQDFWKICTTSMNVTGWQRRQVNMPKLPTHMQLTRSRECLKQLLPVQQKRNKRKRQSRS